MKVESDSKIHAKRIHEKRLVSKMIRIYCKKKHKTRKGLCEECKKLNLYAIEKVDKCPFIETKTFCSSCPVHCYGREKREQIRSVMRFSGPYLIFSCPKEVLLHLLDFFKKSSLVGGRSEV